MSSINFSATDLCDHLLFGQWILQYLSLGVSVCSQPPYYPSSRHPVEALMLGQWLQEGSLAKCGPMCCDTDVIFLMWWNQKGWFLFYLKRKIPKPTSINTCENQQYLSGYLTSAEMSSCANCQLTKCLFVLSVTCVAAMATAGLVWSLFLLWQLTIRSNEGTAVLVYSGTFLTCYYHSSHRITLLN